LGIDNFDGENITRFWSNCKNPKLRNIYFRLIHNDFFTHVRMRKYKMMQTDKCPRCSQTETPKHLLWECEHVKSIWSLFKTLMTQTLNGNECIHNFVQFWTNMIKIKIIQELIQIERPIKWNREKLNSMVRELIGIEQYNANLSRSNIKFNLKWINFDS
jgi:hypothetical protein